MEDPGDPVRGFCVLGDDEDAGGTVIEDDGAERACDCPGRGVDAEEGIDRSVEDEKA